jgi:hypothetical protein
MNYVFRGIQVHLHSTARGSSRFIATTLVRALPDLCDLSFFVCLFVCLFVCRGFVSVVTARQGFAHFLSVSPVIMSLIEKDHATGSNSPYAQIAMVERPQVSE